MVESHEMSKSLNVPYIISLKTSEIYCTIGEIFHVKDEQIFNLEFRYM